MLRHSILKSTTTIHSSRSLIQPRTLATLAQHQQPTMPSVAKDFDALKAVGQKHVATGIGRKWDMIIEKGEGLWVTTTDKKKFLDFTAGIGVTNLGHCHPRVTAAAQEQCGKISHAQCAIAMSVPYLKLVDKLIDMMPTKNLSSFFLWNSGSEANEAAIKVARRYTKKNNIIVMQGGYHGRTYGASALTKSKNIYFEGVGSVMPGVFTTPFPYWHQMGLPIETSEEELVRQAVYQLELVLKQQSSPMDTAALFIEPVMGEGGYVPAPASYLKAVAEICKKNNILLVIDEVQTGFGRTGKLFAIEHIPEVTPDIIVFAKGLANGFPLSGIATAPEIMASMPAGSLGGTYAGNAVACAAACEVADIFASEPILENVNARSTQLFTALNALKTNPKTSKLITEVRGKGLMAAIEFSQAVHGKIQDRCAEKGLMVLTTSMYPVIRFIPALVVSEDEMKLAMNIFTESCEEIAAEL